MLLLFKLLSLLPLRWLHALGALGGRMLFAWSKGYAQRLSSNAAQAGYLSPDTLLLAAQNAGCTVAELPHLWMRTHSRAVANVNVHNGSCIAHALARGKGVIFLTPHMGAFEISAQYCALHHPITVLYRPARKPWLRHVIEHARGQQNLRTAPADLSGVRTLLKALKKGQCIGLLPDQVPSAGEGVWAPFFGRLAYTMTLPGKLAQSTGAAIILAYTVRQPAGQYALFLEKFDQPLANTPLEQATQINAAIERLIAHCPAQYLWSYNRYKIPAGVTPPNQQP